MNEERIKEKEEKTRRQKKKINRKKNLGKCLEKNDNLGRTSHQNHSRDKRNFFARDLKAGRLGVLSHTRAIYSKHGESQKMPEWYS